MTPARVADVLDQARELMSGGERWTRGRNYHKLSGRYCTRGAIAMVLTGHPYGRSPSVTAAYVFVDPLAHRFGLAYFNDTAASWDVVEELLVRAASEARALSPDREMVA